MSFSKSIGTLEKLPIIQYIKSNAPFHLNENLETLSLTELVILKTEIELKQVRMNGPMI